MDVLELASRDWQIARLGRPHGEHDRVVPEAPVSAAAASFAPGNDASVEFSAIPAFPAGSVFAEIVTGLDPVTFGFLPNVPGYDSSGSLNSLILTGNVPEPSTWALVLMGFAGLGFAGYYGTSKAGRAIA